MKNSEMAKWRNGEIFFGEVNYLLGVTRIKRKAIHMETKEVCRFNQAMRLRTRKFAVEIYRLLSKSGIGDLGRIPVRQLMKSASSVAANFSSATRGRSQAEFYSKICVAQRWRFQTPHITL